MFIKVGIVVTLVTSGEKGTSTREVPEGIFSGAGHVLHLDVKYH